MRGSSDFMGSNVIQLAVHMRGKWWDAEMAKDDSGLLSHTMNCRRIHM